VQAQRLPVRIHVLRPPTFEELETQLRRRPGFYHIVHFDGHGGYGEAAFSGSRHSFRGLEGRLHFETPEGSDSPVSAAKLTALLSEHRIPIMVLNACQSARIDARADDPFASVAAALLKAGIRGVVAMGYNLYVSGAQQFVPAFYERLLASGEVAEATRAGRQAMLLQDKRVCARGEHPLQDWLVPVLYQQEALVLSVGSPGPATAPQERLPAEAPALGDYGFIGRQRAIQALERAVLIQPQAGLLIHGMAGVGKTTLAVGYLHWLQQTHGLSSGEDRGLFAGVLWPIFPLRSNKINWLAHLYPCNCHNEINRLQSVGGRWVWLGFDDIHSAEFVINRLVEALFGHEATAAPLEQKRPALIKALRETPVLIVWDNFESAAGIADSEVTPLLPETDRAQLKALLKALRGGKSKVLITSRSPEVWLSPTEVYRLPLGGLEGEDRWEYCNAVVRDLGLKIKRDDPSYAALMDALDGHPLAMRAVLLRLPEKPAGQLLTELKAAFAGAAGDESTRRIFAALSLLDQGLPEAFTPVLALIGLHRRFVDIDSLEQIVQAADRPVLRATLDACFAALEAGGLLHHEGNGIYRMHPAVSGYLTSRHPADEPAQRGFVDFMGRFADQLAPKELHEQRVPFAVHGASFHQALALAAELRMDTHVTALTQSLAAFAQNRRDFAAAEQLFAALAEHGETIGNPEVQAGAYHQLGRIAEEQRDFARAEAWYQKSLAIEEKQGNEHGAANTYHQLGMIAEEQRDFARAGTLFLQALVRFLQHNDSHSLGIVLRSFLRTLQAASPTDQATLRQRWQEAGLDQLTQLGELERQFAEGGDQ
jgi:tetratricopeptide (TPR) repeat protein